MTEVDYKTIQALAKCSFTPGSWNKRFVRDLAQYPPEKELSEKQQAALARVAWHYRQQLSRHGIAVVNKPPDVIGTDKEVERATQDQERLRQWEEAMKEGKTK